jgi:hypothetical protein
MQTQRLIADWLDVPCGIQHVTAVYPFQEGYFMRGSKNIREIVVDV